MGCERTCEATCSFCSHLQCCPKNRPSPLFLSYTVLVNLPLLALAIATGVHAFIKKVIDRPGCGYFIHPGIWLLVAAALSTFYILFAIRIYHTFSKPPTVDPTATSYSQCDSSSLCGCILLFFLVFMHKGKSKALHSCRTADMPQDKVFQINLACSTG
jgi:hypothetical protein